MKIGYKSGVRGVLDFRMRWAPQPTSVDKAWGWTCALAQPIKQASAAEQTSLAHQKRYGMIEDEMDQTAVPHVALEHCQPRRRHYSELREYRLFQIGVWGGKQRAHALAEAKYTDRYG